MTPRELAGWCDMERGTPCFPGGDGAGGGGSAGGHGPGHRHDHPFREASQRGLRTVLLMTAVFMVAEALGGRQDLPSAANSAPAPAHPER